MADPCAARDGPVRGLCESRACADYRPVAVSSRVIDSKIAESQILLINWEVTGVRRIPAKQAAAALPPFHHLFKTFRGRGLPHTLFRVDHPQDVPHLRAHHQLGQFAECHGKRRPVRRHRGRQVVGQLVQDHQFP